MPKLIASIILTTCLNVQTLGQAYQSSLIDSLCNETIKFYYTEYSDAIYNPKNANCALKTAYIETSDLTKNLKNQIGLFRVHYLTDQEALEEISMTKKRTGVFDHITIKQYQDTVDIDIVGFQVLITNVRFENNHPKDIQATREIFCVNDGSFTPTCRFVYNKNANRWTKFTCLEISDQKMTSKM